MPPEQNELDEAYKKYGKRLKEKAKENEPTKDTELRRRVERVSTETPRKAELFSSAESRLQKLEEDFSIEIQQPQSLSDQIIHLITLGQTDDLPKSMIPAADLLMRLKEKPTTEKISMKEFRRVLSRLEKEQVLQLQESEGTLIIRIREEFLSDDEVAVLDLAARKKGVVSLEQVMLSNQWSQARAQAALESLIEKKMVARKTAYTEGTRYDLIEGA